MHPHSVDTRLAVVVALRALEWLILAWFGAALGIGGLTLVLDEWRLHRRKPKPEMVRVYADELESRHGREAFRINGEAMYEAQIAKDFDRYRFLKEVSGVLVSRLVSEAAAQPRVDGGDGTA